MPSRRVVRAGGEQEVALEYATIEAHRRAAVEAERVPQAAFVQAPADVRDAVGVAVLPSPHVVADQFGVEAFALDRMYEALAETEGCAAFHVSVERENDVAHVEHDVAVDLE